MKVLRRDTDLTIGVLYSGARSFLYYFTEREIHEDRSAFIQSIIDKTIDSSVSLV